MLSKYCMRVMETLCVKSTHHCAVTDLKRLNDVEKQFCRLSGQQKASAVGRNVVDLIGTVDTRK